MTNPFKPISRVNLHSEVMQQITAAIQSGQWKSGSKLPGEIALAEMFQVSRTCIREVLKALAYSGVVESRSGVGTFVKDIPSEAPSPAVDLLSSTDYTQILEMRKLLEGQAAYWATERATPEEIAELESILKQEGLSLKDIHTRFHNGVTALSKNPILIHMLAEFQEQFKKQRELNFVILPDEDRLEHWKVLEAIKSGSPAKARRAMHQHIDYIWKKRPHLFPGKKGPDKMYRDSAPNPRRRVCSSGLSPKQPLDGYGGYEKNVLSYGVKELFQIFAGTNSLRATSPPVKSLGKGGGAGGGESF